MSETKTVETTTYDDGSEIVTTKTEETEYVEGDSPTETVALETAIEEVSGNETIAEIEVASIEAERDITIAAIHADTEQARIAAESARESENLEWKTKLETENSELRERVAHLESQLLPLSSPLTMEETEAIAETVKAEILEDLTLQSTSAPTSETETEATLESEEESLVPPLVEIDAPGQRKRVIRLI